MQHTTIGVVGVSKKYEKITARINFKPTKILAIARVYFLETLRYALCAIVNFKKNARHNSATICDGGNDQKRRMLSPAANIHTWSIDESRSVLKSPSGICSRERRVCEGLWL